MVRLTVPATAGIPGQPALAGGPDRSAASEVEGLAAPGRPRATGELAIPGLPDVPGWPAESGSAEVPEPLAAEPGCCRPGGSREETGRPLSRARKAWARSWSAVPANPAARSPRARAEMCWSAAITAAGG